MSPIRARGFLSELTHTRRARVRLLKRSAQSHVYQYHVGLRVGGARARMGNNGNMRALKKCLVTPFNSVFVNNQNNGGGSNIANIGYNPLARSFVPSSNLKGVTRKFNMGSAAFVSMFIETVSMFATKAFVRCGVAQISPNSGAQAEAHFGAYLRDETVPYKSF